MLLILIAIAAGMILIERCWPARELPVVRGWWMRIALVNGVQVGLVVLAGLTWDRWCASASLLEASEWWGDWVAAGVTYVVSTFVYYWWHRVRHESVFFWRLCHQLHHSPRRIELLASFYKHPVEICLNSLISEVLVYSVMGCSVRAAAVCTGLTAVAEYFYHWNIRTPRWLGWVVQRPESHRVHHKYRHHTMNYADLPVWDWMFGTLWNPGRAPSRCGFDEAREQRVVEMLMFRDVHRKEAKVGKEAEVGVASLTCIGCSKRWACGLQRSREES